MNITVCDRCHREIKSIDFDDFKEGAWRYMIVEDCHPYPETKKIDLCLNCKKQLVRWLKGVDDEW